MRKSQPESTFAETRKQFSLPEENRNSHAIAVRGIDEQSSSYGVPPRTPNKAVNNAAASKTPNAKIRLDNYTYDIPYSSSSTS